MVFETGGLAFGGPRYLLYGREPGEIAGRKVACANVGNIDDKAKERLPRADLLPARAVEVDYTRRSELL